MRICIVGAGVSALTTAKELKSKKFEVEMFDKRSHVGGLWHFDKKTSTVSDHTVLSTSVSFIQFSDFPEMDATNEGYFPNYKVYLAYLEKYIQKHDLMPLIKLEHEVKKMVRNGDKWDVTIANAEGEFTNTYDYVVVCTGLNHEPSVPRFEGDDIFKGVNIHSSLLESTDSLKDKKVLIVGGGESAADLAHAALPYTKSIAMAFRKGQIVTLSKGPGQRPADHGSFRAKVWLPKVFLHDFHHCCIPKVQDQFSAFRTFYTLIVLPIALITLQIRPFFKLLLDLFNYRMWRALFVAPERHGPASGVELSKAIAAISKNPPKSEAEVEQRFWKFRKLFTWYSGGLHNSQPFTKSPAFFYDIARGDIAIRSGIKRYHEHGVEFEDGSVEEFDVVVLCTGFRMLLPFLDDLTLDGRKLFKNTFMPELPNMAFLGFARGSIGATPPVPEMQARWLSGLLTGRLQLPSVETMQAVIKTDAECYNKRLPNHANRLTFLIDYHAVMEELAGIVGCKPQLWRLITKPKLFYAVLFGPMTCYQYRIHGPDADLPAVEKAIAKMPPPMFFRVIQGIVLYVFMKPVFTLLSALGFNKFKPTL
jgi:dimethylaniline monooxygenase (N-oxide forming)